MDDLHDKISVVLMLRILDVVRESGVYREEAMAALQGAQAMVGELNLPVRPLMIVG
jgi:hypothetical protein